MVLNTEESIKHYCAGKVLKYFGTQATKWGSTWESIEVPEGQVKAIQELYEENQAEKAKNEALETQVSDLLVRVTALENA
jgi:hypothetical protein